ncbi:MAG: alpha/beta fold hydrolase, partial [Aquabacterium sp.]|nr:alpha/beta fold hydrolase [Aquabacterium sp.]
MSPASFLLSMLDWWIHLAFAPGKQSELRHLAREQAVRLADALLAPGEGVEPGAQAQAAAPANGRDGRFAAPAWQQWPWSLLRDGFLMTEAWWDAATTGVRGVTPHHEHVVSFAARQWLDAMCPANLPWLNPEVIEATRRENGANLMRGALNFSADWLRSLTQAPPPGTEAFQVGRDVAVTPGQVVYRNDLIELIQYTPTTARVHPEPVLILPSWIMKYYILDLSPHNSLVRWLVEQGHTVFMVSWRNPGPQDRNLGMDDYLRSGPLAALDAVSTILPGRRVHAMGYCLGGTLLAIAAAALARDDDQRIATLSLLAAQTDFEEPGELSLFIDESQITYLEDQMWARGFLDGSQMGGSFTFLNTRDLVWSRMVRDYLLGTRMPLNDLMAWNADTTRMPYRMHVEYLRSLYLRNDLAHGAYRVGDKPVSLNDVRVPVFAVGTVKDHVSPWRSVYKIHQLCDAEITFALTSGGHNAGIVSEPGHRNRRYQLHTRPHHGKHLDPDTWLALARPHEGSWWLAWHDWLVRRSGPLTPPPA